MPNDLTECHYYMADPVYDDVKDRIPGVSRTTVYRTLETFVDLGMSRKTSHVAVMARFDGNVERYHHQLR